MQDTNGFTVEFVVDGFNGFSIIGKQLKPKPGAYFPVVRRPGCE
jgi:hypothetical protein